MTATLRTRLLAAVRAIAQFLDGLTSPDVVVHVDRFLLWVADLIGESAGRHSVDTVPVHRAVYCLPADLADRTPAKAAEPVVERYVDIPAPPNWDITTRDLGLGEILDGPTQTDLPLVELDNEPPVAAGHFDELPVAEDRALAVAA